MSDVEDASRVIEACFSGHSRAALLYPTNLTADFFDLSSGQVVCFPGTVRFSRRFGEVLAEERRCRFFGVFDTRREAVEWLRC